jgi:hypothetical protein
MKTGNNISTIYLDDFLTEGILKEKEFREKVKQKNWKHFNNKKVLIKGCASVPIPTWAYMIVATQLTKYAKQVLYGERCSAFLIFKKT